MQDKQEITLLLERWRNGERNALDDLYAQLYADLKKNAYGVLGAVGEDATLSATEIANEAYVRLVRYPMDENRAPFAHRKQFFGLAQKAMLHILLDHHRKKKTQRRGGHLQRVDDGVEGVQQKVPCQPDIAVLEHLLGELAVVRPDWYQIIHQRFTCEQPQTVRKLAGMLELSEREIYRKTNLGLAWMRRGMEQLEARS